MNILLSSTPASESETSVALWSPEFDCTSQAWSSSVTLSVESTVADPGDMVQAGLVSALFDVNDVAKVSFGWSSGVTRSGVACSGWGIQILAVMVLFGPIGGARSLRQDREWPITC